MADTPGPTDNRNDEPIAQQAQVGDRIAPTDAVNPSADPGSCWAVVRLLPQGAVLAERDGEVREFASASFVVVDL